jgi:hypothetical protein
MMVTTGGMDIIRRVLGERYEHNIHSAYEIYDIVIKQVRHMINIKRSYAKGEYHGSEISCCDAVDDDCLGWVW